MFSYYNQTISVLNQLVIVSSRLASVGILGKEREPGVVKQADTGILIRNLKGII